MGLLDFFVEKFEPETDEIRIEVQLRHPEAQPPHRSRASDAGWDLHSLIDADISPGDVVDIDTGMAVVAPEGYYFTVEGRSSLYKAGVVPFRGIIDGGYTGNMIISLMNVGKDKYCILKGDRIAQIIPHRIVPVKLEIVDTISPHYDIRGKKGFGSSGR